MNGKRQSIKKYLNKSIFQKYIQFFTLIQVTSLTFWLNTILYQLAKHYPIILYQNQIVMEGGGLSGGGFTKMSKLIQSNRIEVSILEDSMRKEVERYRQTYQYPASIGKAIMHRHAAKFGFRKDLKGEIPVVCPCCRLRMDNQPISICYDSSENTIEVQHNYQEFKLPAGVAVFFSILKATIAFLFVLTAFMVYGFITKDICQIHDIYPEFNNYRCPFPDPNPVPRPIPEQAIFIIDILFLGALIVSMVFFILYRKSKHSWHRFIYSKNQTQEAYTVLISNIPVLDFPKAGQGKSKSEFFYRKHLQDYLEGRVRAWVQTSDTWQRGVDSNQNDFLEVLNRNDGQLKSKAIVKSISLCYNLNRLEIIDDTRAGLIEQHEQQQQEGTALVEQSAQIHGQQDRFSTLPKKIQFINDCRLVLNNQYAQDNSFLFNLTHFVGHAFVSFQYQHYRNFFLDQYERNPKGFVYNGNVLKFMPAAGPTQINWKNLRMSVHQKERMQLNSYFIMLLIVLVQYVILFGLHLILYNVHNLSEILTSIADLASTKPDPKKDPLVFIIVASFVIIIVNSLLKKTITSLVASERHKTRVNETTTYMNKSVLSQLFSSGISLFLLNTILGTHQDLHFYANIFIAISSIIEVLYQLIHPSWIAKSVRRWWRYRGKEPKDTVEKFQCQLNKQFEYPEFELAKRYSYYIYKTYLALFFAYPAPLGIFITFLTLAVMYWIDKINLFRRCSLYYPGNLSISNHALKMLQFSLIVFAGSFLFFSSQSQHKLNIFGVIALILAFLYELLVLTAPAKLGRLIFGRQAASDKYIYDDCVGDGKFNQTYWNTNPATMLVEQQSVTGKEMVTNPALMRRFPQMADYQHIF